MYVRGEGSCMLRMGLAEPGIQAVLSSPCRPRRGNMDMLLVRGTSGSCTCFHVQMSTCNTDSVNLGERQMLQFSFSNSNKYLPRTPYAPGPGVGTAGNKRNKNSCPGLPWWCSRWESARVAGMGSIPGRGRVHMPWTS